MADQPPAAQASPFPGMPPEPTALPEYVTHGINTVEPEVPGPDHAAGNAPAPGASAASGDDCKSFTELVHGGGGTRCGKKTIDDPVNMVSPILAVVGGLLIIAGVLTLAGVGPARWFKTTSRSRRAIAKMRRRRYLAAAAMIASGVGSVALMLL